MIVWFRSVLSVALLVCLLGGAVRAAPLDDASAANRRGDFTTALKLYRPLADQGNVEAQFSLGGLYGAGLGGVPQDHVESMKWLRLAAAQPSQIGAMAQLAIGVKYAMGWGVPQNCAEAAKWWRFARAQGNQAGQMFLDGAGVAGAQCRR
jgi:TPR repeat protein